MKKTVEAFASLRLKGSTPKGAGPLFFSTLLFVAIVAALYLFLASLRQESYDFLDNREANQDYEILAWGLLYGIWDLLWSIASLV